MDTRLNAAPSRAHASAVDRLIELASDRQPQPDAVHEPTPASHEILVPPIEAKELANDPMWKTLLQFKGILPYVARLLPLLDLDGGHTQTTSLTISTELKKDVTDLQTTQRDLRVAMQDQTLQLKRFEDQLVRIREASEKSSFENSELVEDVRSMHALVRNMAISLGLLLLVLIGMVAYLVGHLRQ
jgi:hypothetical protein